jgi:hypothetical protein
MATEPISTAYFLNLSYQSVCLYVYLSYRYKVTARLSVFLHLVRLGKHVPAATNTCYNRKIVLCGAAPVLSTESPWVCSCIPLLLLGNNLVKALLRQQRTPPTFQSYISLLLSACLVLVSCLAYFSTLRMERYVPPKSWCTCTELRGVTTVFSSYLYF